MNNYNENSLSLTGAILTVKNIYSDYVYIYTFRRNSIYNFYNSNFCHRKMVFAITCNQ